MADTLDDMFGRWREERWNELFGSQQDDEEKKPVRDFQAGNEPHRRNRIDPGIDALKDPEQSREIARMRNVEQAKRGAEERRESQNTDARIEQHRAEDEEAIGRLPGILRGPARAGLGLAHGWEGALAAMREGRAEHEIAVGRDSAEVRAEAERESEEARYYQESGPDGALAWFGSAVGLIGGSLYSSAKRATEAAAAGGAIGATAGAPGGLPGAVGGALAGGSVGLTAGFVSDSFKVNSGFIAGELRKAVGPNGETVDPDIAYGAAMVGGGVMAALDLVSFGVLSAPLRGAIRSAIAKEASENIAKRLVSPRNEAAKEFIKGWSAETITETLQTVVENVAKDAAKAASDEDFATIFNSDERRSQFVDELVETALVTATGMSVVALPGAAVRYRTAKNERDDQLANSLGEPFTDPRTASDAFTPGRNTIVPKAALDRGARHITPADEASPLPTDLIQQGKGQAELDVEAVASNDILARHGFPTVGKDVVLRRGPDGIPETGRVMGSFNVDGFDGVRVQLSDGTTYEELIDDMQRGGHSLMTAEDYLATPPPAPAEAYVEPAADLGPAQETAVSSANARDVLKSKIGRVESGGNDRAKNPRSSASGRYQFIDSTWEALGGDPNKRFDPAEQERLMDKLLDQNEAALGRAGIPTTAGNLYLAHFLGSGGAIKAYADPNAKVSAKVQNANPFARGWTNAQLIAWADKKMGGAGAIAGGTATDRPDIEYEDFELDFARDENGQPFLDVEEEAEGQSYTDKVAAADKLTAEQMLAETKRQQPDFQNDDDILARPEWRRTTLSLDRIQEASDTNPDPYNRVIEIDPERVRAAAESSDPIIIDEKGWALDGNHRVAAARARGDKTIEAWVPAGTPIGTSTAPTVAGQAKLQQITGEKIDDEWNRFAPEAGGLNIPRADMPQIKGEHRGAMVNFLEARGIAHREETVPAETLKPTQAEFSPDKAASWDRGNVKLEERAILTSSDGHILDGHHQWVKALERGEDLKIIRLNAPIAELLPAVREFPSAKLSDGALPKQDALKARLAGKRLAGEPTIQPDLLGGPELTTADMDAQDYIPKVLQAAVDRDVMENGRDRDIIIEAARYVLNPKNTPGDMRQSMKEIGEAIGRRMETAEEARSYAREILRQLRLQREGDEEAPDAPDAADARPDASGEASEAKSNADVLQAAKDSGRLEIVDARSPSKQDQLKDKMRSNREAREAAALDYDTTERHERVRIMEAAGINSKLLAGGPKRNSGTPFNDLPETVQTLIQKQMGYTAKEPVSTAPEHANVGVTDKELSEVVITFEEYLDGQGRGDEQVHHLFDPPAKDEIVRLQDKVRVYHSKHGWMTPAEAREKIREWEEKAVAQGRDQKTRDLNGNKVVLSFFDLSGEWSLPWEQAGYDVYRFDIQDDPEVGDVNNFSTDFFNDWFGSFDGKEIHAILAACPCTDFAVSGARHFAAKDEDGRTVASVELVKQTLAAIEYFKPAVWAIENPVGRIEKLGGLPPWRLSFDPNHVGETYTKKTLLWGRFNADLPIAPVDPVEGSKMHKQYGGKSLKTKNARSVTPEGFAYAFFLANNAIDHPAMTIANRYDRLDRKAIEEAVAAGVTEQQIDEAVEDFYYTDLDDSAANAAIKELTRARKMGAKPAEPKAKEGATKTVTPAQDKQLERAVEDARKEAEPFQRQLAEWAEKQTAPFKNPGIKGTPRIVEKMRGEPNNYRVPKDLKDIVRGQFVVSSEAEKAAVVEAIKAEFDVIEDKGERAVSGGYFDHKLIVSFAGDIKGEIQVAYGPIAEKQKELHKVYEEWRSIPGHDLVNAPAEARELERQMIEGYAKAASGTSFANAFKSAMEAYASRNSFAKSAWESIEPSFLTSPGAGAQTSRNENANARPPETPLATGKPSISKNESSAIDADISSAPSANKYFTEDAYEKAREVLRDKFRNQLNSGLDPEIALAGITVAGYHIEKGARAFGAYAKAMVSDFGRDVIPYLRSWYEAVRYDPRGAEFAKDMSGPEEIGAALADLERNEAHGIIEQEATDARTTTEETAAADNRASDEESGSADLSPTESGRDSASGDRGQGESGRGSVRDDVRRGEDSQPQVGQAVHGTVERSDDGAERSGTSGARPSDRVSGKRAGRGRNYVAAPGGLKRQGGWKATAERNLEIVALVNRIEAENRPATPEEQALLAKFTGWGASEIRNNLFRNTTKDPATGEKVISKPMYAGEWTDLIEKARELLRGEDLEQALQSVQYAHYTGEDVVRPMWEGIKRLGFTGGRILEPGMGIGNFLIAAPQDVAGGSVYTGIEFDSFTARIAKLLLPQENVLHADYTKQKLPDGFFDIAIGNPPFSNVKVLNDPAYKKQRFSLHDFFFAKSIDKVRPGGLLVFVTSHYTMDKLDAKARQYIADRADLLGAIRLPQTAFKENAGTEVVTDILFLQRRPQDAERGGEDWLSTATVKLKNKDGATDKAHINEYFKAHPEMVLGKQALTGSQYRANEYTVEPYATKKIDDLLAEAVARLPENAYTDAPAQAVEATKAKTFERDFAPASQKEGGLYAKDGKLYVRTNGVGVAAEEIARLSPKDKAWLSSYIKVRDALKEAQKSQLQDSPDWEAKLATLQKQYRAFVKKHGRIGDFTVYERTETDEDGETTTTAYRRYKNSRLLALDIESVLVEQLEKVTDENEIVDGAFLTGRTLNKPKRPKIESSHDALAVTLDELGKVDLDYAAKLYNVTREQLVDELGERIYESPSEGWLTDDSYLSGDVLTKLEEAEAAAASDPRFERNVKALLKVQPKPLGPDQITVRLGAGWVPVEVISKFAKDELKLPEDIGVSYDVASGIWGVGVNNVQFDEEKGKFKASGLPQYLRRRISDYGTDDRSPGELLNSLLNNQPISITRTETIDRKKKTVVDATATAAANEAARRISERFKAWVWQDAKRADMLVEIYNRKFNNIATREFNGDHLTLPGLSAKFKPHPHVKRAVWRIIQSGNTYLGHAVGAGKTAEQIISAMEQRRLGLIKKPMFVVPNHMLNQFANEFLELYPAANIMVADEKSFHTTNRKRFMAQAALNDPDAIIITHSSFGKLEPSNEARNAVLNDLISDLEEALEEAKTQDNARIAVREIQNRIEKLKNRFEAKQAAGDKVVTFEEMGVDFLYVDEAHMFRKLDFVTNRKVKGIDPNGSVKALDLFIKTRWLDQQNPGRSLVLASGTPVTNTMAEIYTVMRYMDSRGLERDGIQSFDAWANMFGEVASAYERNAAGVMELVERFSKFTNVPELMKRVRMFMDVITSDQLGGLVKRPAIRTKIPENVVVEASPQLKQYMKEELDRRIKISREWKPSPNQPGNPDPLINIITDARLATIDARFFDPTLRDDPSSKLNKMLDAIIAKHKEYKGLSYVDPRTGAKDLNKGGVQIVFSAIGFGEQVASNRGFDIRAWIDKRLVEGGFKKSEIAWMSDASSHAKKEELQKRVRAGLVKVLIGSPQNMGTGLNVQRRLKALHYLAPPWYPADVEQPHGRIIRQGNLNEEVDISWYATKGTYDATQWQMVSRKQKFIEQAFLGDDSVRTLEDISEASQYEMAAALAAGDDRVIQVAALSSDIERLRRLSGAHEEQQRNLKYEKREIEGWLPRQEQRVKEWEAADKARGTGYRAFAVTIGKETFDQQGKAGEAVLARVEKLGTSKEVEVGKLYGEFPILVVPKDDDGFVLAVSVGGVQLDATQLVESPASLDPVGTMQRIQNKVQQIPTSLSAARKEVADSKARLQEIGNKLGAPFEFAGELREKVAEKAQLEEALAAEGAAEQQSTADSNPDVAASAFEGGGAFVRSLTKEQEQQISERAAEILRKLLPNDRPALTFAHNLMTPPIGGDLTTSEPVQGFYDRRRHLIAMSYEVNQGHEWVLGHETLHAMRRMGLFTKSEWNLLVASAWTNDVEMQEGVKRRWKGLTLEQMQEEAVAEYIGQTIYDLESGSKKMRFVMRMAYRVFDAIAAIIKGIGLILRKDTSHIDAHFLARRIASGKIGKRPMGYGMEASPNAPAVAASVAGDISPASPEFSNPETEARFQKGREGVGRVSLVTRLKDDWHSIKVGFTRHWKHLPNEPRFAGVQQKLRVMEAAPEVALEEIVRHLRGLVKDFTPADMDLFTRKVVLDDLMWEDRRGHDLPFGFTPETLRADLANIDAILATKPKVADAVRKRKAYNRRMSDAMVKAGVLTEEQVKNPAYFRHMVLQYASAEVRAMDKDGFREVLINGQKKKIRSPYWARRMGSTLDINANLFEAELEWMLKAHVDIATANAIEWIKKNDKLNIRDKLRAQAKAENKAAIDALTATDPALKKEEAKFRQLVGRGMAILKDVIRDGHLVPPPHLQDAADALVNGSTDSNVFPLVGWVMDNGAPGSDGAAMILSSVGRRKQWERLVLKDRYINPDNIKELVAHYKPDGFTAWQPIEGQHLFTAKTLGETALDMFADRIGQLSYEGVSQAELERAVDEMKSVMVIGSDRYTMIIPTELAMQLNDYGDATTHNLAVRTVGELQAAWKRWVLINPRRYFKYNLNNMSGDLDAIIAGNPHALTKVGQAAKEIAAIWRDKKKPSQEYRDARERGVFTSGLSAQEIPDINQISGIRQLMARKSHRPDRMLVQTIANVWNALQGSTNYREAVFRYAAYLDYIERMEKGQPQSKIGYGASVPNMVDAVEDTKDRAALLARDLVGDYGAISVAGSWLRRYLIPFWSWREINTKRYYRLVANAFRVSKAKGLATGGFIGAGIAARSAATLTVRMGIVYGILWTVNNLFFPDEEEELDDAQRRQMHLILGRDKDGKVITLRMQGALADVLSFMGFPDAVDAWKKWQNGHAPFSKVAIDTAKAPLNTIATSISPLYGLPIEGALGEKLWPDVFDRRPIYDQKRNVASAFSLENEYDALADKPTRGYGRSWTESFVYRRDPGEMSYNEARSIAFNWLEDVKGEEGGGGRKSDRSLALRDYKMALRYGDREAAIDALRRYGEYDGTVSGLKQSIKRAAPLNSIPKKWRREFVASLTEEQVETFRDAEAWYAEVYLGKGAGSEEPAR